MSADTSHTITMPVDDPRVQGALEKYRREKASWDSKHELLQYGLRGLAEALKSLDEERHGFDDNSLTRWAASAGLADLALAALAAGGTVATTGAAVALLTYIANALDQKGDERDAFGKVEQAKLMVKMVLEAYLDAIDNVNEAEDGFMKAVDSWWKENKCRA